jgi:predicted Zn-dependent peptidase
MIGVLVPRPAAPDNGLRVRSHLLIRSSSQNQLDLGLFLEADRMHGLVITADNVEN